jgi:hypothetical protein
VTGVVTHEATAPRMRAIWDYFDTPDPTHTLGGGVDWLNFVKRWPAPLGGKWSKNTLKYLIFEQGYYWGAGEAYKTVTVDVRVADPETGEYDIEHRQRKRPKSDRLPMPTNNVPPLITAEQAARVHAYLPQKKDLRHYTDTTLAGTPSKRPAHTWNPDDFLLMDGLLRCGVCGHKLYPGVRQGRASYRCETGNRYPRGHEARHQLSINAAVADRFAIEQTLKLLYTPGESDAAFDRLAARSDDTEADLATAVADLARTDATLATRRSRLTASWPRCSPRTRWMSSPSPCTSSRRPAPNRKHASRH